MHKTDPMITNATEGRFLFGCFRVSNDGVIFQGSAVYGAGFSYDPETGQPITGFVHRIEVQTRSADQVIAVHSTLANIDTPVQGLNATYTNADAPWFDATDLLDDPVDTASALNDNCDLHLITGDILTAKEMNSIAKAKDPDPAIKTQRDLDGLDDIIDMLNISAKDIPRETDLPDFTSDDFGDLQVFALR